MGLLTRLRIGSTATTAVFRFVVAGLLAAGIITAGAYWVVNRNAIAEATRNAQEIAVIDGRGIVEPALTDQLLAGDPTAIANIDRLVRERVLSARVVRVKLWTAAGRIVYSDARPLVGRSFVLDTGEQQAMRNGNVVAEVTELTKPENVYERPFGRLLEVYLPIRSASNTTLLFETYQVYSSIDEDQQRIWSAFFPVLAGGILLLFVVQIPLAWGLARSLEASLTAQEELLKRALDASESERRRIARDLHDGVVQTLAGTAFMLSATARRARTATPDELEHALTEGANAARAAAGDLRTLIVDIAPPDLQGSRLEGALADLLAPLEAQGIASSLRADELDRLDTGTSALLFRAAQEAIRNAVAHAEATSIEVVVAASSNGAELEVADNGRGFTADEVIQRQREGHVGLAMLKGLVEDAGGELSVASDPSSGTRVRVRIGRDE
ncbi:MAG: two-component system, NarL family, sensor kinase [Chloroflexota bacterium]|jgi:signal transduction histidine kinase|nr:two-component system, NarL family, sensor kinase [Chloroflexota bacterium]